MRRKAVAIAFFITVVFFFIDSILPRDVPAYVERVIDGDTIETDIGTVRLLGINAPEKGEPYYQDAKNFLSSMVKGKNIILSGSKRDKYGRLLADVYVGSLYVNLELVRQGYAAAYMTEGTKHRQEILKAEDSAKEKGLGIWKKGNYSSCLRILEFNWNAEGDDNKNLNGEYFRLKNSCGKIDMDGWVIRDNGRVWYKIRKFAIIKTATIYTGCGNNTEEKLYMCMKHAVWNNNGDTLFIYDSNGDLVLSYSY